MANLSLTRTYNRIFTAVSDIAPGLIWDNVSTRTKTLFRMRQLGAIDVVGGQPHLRFTIMKELPTTVGYNDLDTLTPVRGDPITALVYEWKQLATPVQVSGLDMIKTDEASGVDNLLNIFITSAETSMRDSIGGSTVGIFSDAGESELRKISGLQNMLSSSNTTGTVGQLSRATESDWRHQVGNISNDFSANGIDRLRTIYRQTSRFDENVDTIVGTGSFAENYEKNITSTLSLNQPLTGDKAMLDVGFDNIFYKGAVIFDDDGCPANRAYALNFSKFTKLVVRSGREADIGEFVKSQGRDDLVSYVLWAGNLITTNLARQGVLLNGDTN